MIINYKELENPIKEIEHVLERYDQEEINLILRQIQQRRNKKLQDMKVRETVDGHPIMKFASKFMKDKGDE